MLAVVKPASVGSSVAGAQNHDIARWSRNVDEQDHFV